MSETITTNQYFCASERRRDLARSKVDSSGDPVVNGIDFIEVSPLDQKTLFIHFIHNVPGESDGVPATPVLSASNFVIEGGVRITDVTPVAPITAASNVITLKVDKPGDYSTYTLRLVTSSAVGDPPVGFDRLLAQVEFSFKVNCESDFDCRASDDCLDTPRESPYINYLAKDYSSFRRLILDRLSVTMPGWRERSAADIGIALVELLAYTGDYLSYYQDSVGTEAYLGTSRRRTSVRRHARLVDYALDDGSSARTWLVFETDADRGNALAPAIPKSTMILASPAEAKDPQRVAGSVIFETMHEIVELRIARNEIPFYTWGDANCCLPKGATRATLEGPLASTGLKKGDFLVFEEVLGEESGLKEDADRGHRHVVRLVNEPVERLDPLTDTTVIDIEWHSDDALPFVLCLREFDDGSGSIKQASVCRGNVAIADHGETHTSTSDLVPSLVPSSRPYRPFLKYLNLSQTRPFAGLAEDSHSAYRLMQPQRGSSAPSITLRGNGETWRPRRDLLASDGFAPEFVVEIENDGRAYLRFGDGRLGRQPEKGSQFTATYRTGTGLQGNVGAEALNQIVPAIPGVKVRNPLSARGGEDPEPISHARLLAPVAFRTQERAVTEDDYAAAAERHPDVQRAAATRRWTGSWYTMFITIDRRGGSKVDVAFEQEMRAFLERFRLAGYDIEIDAPRYVPLEIVMTVCARPGFLRTNIKQALFAAFNNRLHRDGSQGFFHPDNFSFGQSVYLSQVIARAMQVPGVESVSIDDTPPRPNLFRRWGQDSDGELDLGFIPIHRLEIARLDNDPSALENGRIDFVVKGAS